MNAKSYLNKIRYIDLMIDCKLSQVEELRSRLLNVTAVNSDEKVQHNNNDDKFATIISKIVDMQNEINSDIDKLIDLKKEATQYIELLNNSIEKVILYKRYFKNQNFEEIAVECGYTWRHIHRLHDSALKNFDKILKKS